MARPHRRLTLLQRGHRRVGRAVAGIAETTSGRKDWHGLLDSTIDVDADVRDVYAQWIAFEDYPDFMAAIESVTLIDDDRLLWVAEVEGVTHEWDTDLVDHVDEQKIEWGRVADGREVGEVRFEKLGGGAHQSPTSSSTSPRPGRATPPSSPGGWSTA